MTLVEKGCLDDAVCVVSIGQPKYDAAYCILLQKCPGISKGSPKSFPETKRILEIAVFLTINSIILGLRNTQKPQSTAKLMKSQEYAD